MKMKRNQPEKKLVVNPVIDRLKFRVLTGDILWFQRLVAESDPNAKAGTPDIIAVVDCKDGKIAVLFIECKKPSKKKPSLDDLRFDQRLFFARMEGKPMILCVVINKPSQLWPAIKKARNLKCLRNTYTTEKFI